MMARLPVVSAAVGTCTFVASIITAASAVHSAWPVQTKVPSNDPHYLQQQQEQRLRWESSTTSPPPIVLQFLTLNGSVVNGPDIDLLYTFRTTDSRTGARGREATHAEIHDLAQDGVTMCFAVSSAAVPSTCAPILRTSLTFRNGMPAAWHTITATLVYDPAAATSARAAAAGDGVSKSSGSEERGDPWRHKKDLGASASVTIFLSVEGYPELPFCGGSACLDSSDVRSAYFDQIYRQKTWLKGDSRSGSGSEVAATEATRAAVEEVFVTYGVTSILDAPCGDLTWMPFVKGIQNVRYTGADIAATVVEDNRRKFGQIGSPRAISDTIKEGNADHGPTAREELGLRDPAFIEADLIEGVPASGDGQPFDLIFVRDMMLHLPPRHNMRVLKNIEASGARLFMASTFLDGDENFSADTFVPADGHQINLAKAPYCLRPPIALFHDSSTGIPGHRMGLWELDPDRPLFEGGDCGRSVWS